jgi:hypothetical protein
MKLLKLTFVMIVKQNFGFNFKLLSFRSSVLRIVPKGTVGLKYNPVSVAVYQTEKMSDTRIVFRR